MNLTWRGFMGAFLLVGMPGLMTQPVEGQTKTFHYTDTFSAVVNMASFNDPFAFTIQYEEAHHPSGKAAMRAFLKKRKLEAQRATPIHEGIPVSNRGSVPAPEILASFSGNNIITGTPLDNHLAVNEAEQVISTINT